MTDSLTTLVSVPENVAMMVFVIIFMGIKSRKNMDSEPAKTSKTLENIRSENKHLSVEITIKTLQQAARHLLCGFDNGNSKMLAL